MSFLFRTFVFMKDLIKKIIRLTAYNKMQYGIYIPGKYKVIIKNNNEEENS